jgi:pimeloyl-ACP methyl ester carboxylesterase
MVTVGRHKRGGVMPEMTWTLLFIHGFLDDATVWDGVIDALAGKVGMVRYNLPGFGTRKNAVADPRDVTLESLAAEAGDIVAHIDGPVIVVGQSMGSQIAELVAAGHANRVQGLVLLTPVPLGGTELPTEDIEPFRALGGNADAQRALRAQVSPNLAAHQLDRLVRIGSAVRPDVAARYADVWNEGVSDAPAVSEFTGPVLMIRGAADGFVTEELVAAISPRFARPDVRVIENGGHWVHIEYPAAVAAMILAFTRAIAEVAA